MSNFESLEQKVISPLHSQELIMVRMHLPDRIYRVARALFMQSKEHDARMYIARQYIRAREHALEHEMYAKATLFNKAYENTTRSCALPHCDSI